jgi:hypothetical protein
MFYFQIIKKKSVRILVKGCIFVANIYDNLINSNVMGEIKSGFDTNEGILYTKPVGDITIDYMLNGIEMLSANKELPKDLKILENALEAKATFQSKDISMLAEKLDIALENFNSIRHAVVHKNHLNTAFAILIGNKIKNHKYTLKVFSSVEAANAWLLMCI